MLTAKAMDYGANYIEKHVTFKRNEKKPDYISSFEPHTLDEYINFFKKYFKQFRKEISLKEENIAILWANLLSLIGILKRVN